MLYQLSFHWLRVLWYPCICVYINIYIYIFFYGYSVSILYPQAVQTPKRHPVTSKKHTTSRPSIPMTDERWAFAQSVPAGEVPMKVQLRTKRRLVFLGQNGVVDDLQGIFSARKKKLVILTGCLYINRERLVSWFILYYSLYSYITG